MYDFQQICCSLHCSEEQSLRACSGARQLPASANPRAELARTARHQEADFPDQSSVYVQKTGAAVSAIPESEILELTLFIESCHREVEENGSCDERNETVRPYQARNELNGLGR